MWHTPKGIRRKRYQLSKIGAVIGYMGGALYNPPSI